MATEPHLGAHWVAKYNVSCQRRCWDERSHVNCLGYNRNLPVRPSHLPWQLGLTSCQVLVNTATGSTLVCGCTKRRRRPDFTRHLFIIYKDKVGCTMIWFRDAVIIWMWKKRKRDGYSGDGLSPLTKLKCVAQPPLPPPNDKKTLWITSDKTL